MPLTCDNQFIEDQIGADRKTLSVGLLRAWKPDAATFDDENLVPAAGLVPVLALAEQTHLSDLIQEQVRFD